MRLKVSKNPNQIIQWTFEQPLKDSTVQGSAVIIGNRGEYQEPTESFNSNFQPNHDVQQST
jgi:hypothetical protein